MMGPGNGGYGGGPGGYGPPPGQGGYGPPPGGAPPPGGYGPPPGGYGPPPGGYGGPGGPGPMGGGGNVGQLAAMTERSPVTVILLSMVTCGIYAIIWKYQTTDELRQASGDNSINPGLDILLTFVTCGIWAVYSDYRNAKKCYELAQKHGLNRQDQSTMVLITMLLGVGIVGWYLLQQEYNHLSAAGRGTTPSA